MPGLSAYAAQAEQNWATGDTAPPAVTTRYVGLLTTAPNDAGSGAVASRPYTRSVRTIVLQL